MKKDNYKKIYKAFDNYTDEEYSKLSEKDRDRIITEYNTKKIKRSILICLILIVLIFIAMNCISIIPTRYVGVKTKFGKVQTEVLQEGLNLKIPFIEDVNLMDCKTKKIEVSSEASSKDLQIVNITIAVNYNVEKQTAHKLYSEIGLDYENIIIQPAISESVKSITAQYTAEELITKRSEVSAMIHEALFNKIYNKGFDISEFNIINIDFSDAFNKAIEDKAVKQQEVISAQAELDKQKILNEKEISVAEKDAKVMELQNSQITENTLKLKELEVKEKLINKWNGQFPNTMLGNDTNALFNIGE